MPTRLRTLVWREMPPCVRRISLWWSRKLYYAELYLGQLYLSWTRSPTWNFVAVAGTFGILLTILLFLAPWNDAAEVHAGLSARNVPPPRPAWELDSRLANNDTTNEPAYPVELLRARGIRAVAKPSMEETDVPSRRRRRTFDPADEQPLAPIIAHEPIVAHDRAEPVVADVPRNQRKPPRRTTAVESDWLTHAEPDPPQLALDVELVVPRRRRMREPIVEEMTWTGQSAPTDAAALRRTDRFRDDGWMAFDPDAVAETNADNNFGWSDEDEETVAAWETDGPLGEPWQPPDFPASAEPFIDVDLELELSWNSFSRRARSGRLSVRNLGRDPVARIDVVAGQIPEIDLSGALEVPTQPIVDLPPDDEESVWVPRNASRRRTASEFVTVLVTEFIGSTTQVSAPAPPARSPAPPPPPPVERRLPRREIVPERRPDRPHLTITAGEPGPLGVDNMLAVPIVVTNDGNVPLDGVAIVAEIPETLQHEYGRRVRHWLGRLSAGERRRARLFLTPLEAGSATVPLEASDGARSATDRTEASVRVTEQDVAGSR